MGKTLYAVSKGSYSDYRVVAIFDKKELAEKFKPHVEDYNDIEEYELNPGIEAVQRDYLAFHVEMLRNGDVAKTFETDFTYAIDSTPVLFPQWDSAGRKQTGKKVLRVITWARNEKHAVKITNEKRAMLIASGEWADEI